MNAFLDKLHQVIGQLAATTGRLASAGEQIAAMARDQARTADTQRDETHQVATAMQEMAATVQEVSRNSTQAADASAQAAATASAGGQVVQETLTKMQRIADAVGTAAEQIQSLGRSSHRVGEIVGVIGDIASQTNLLALNAAIEAARAGDQGRGFAVVADEVRKLAARTTAATREIAEMIGAIQGETDGAVAAMQAGTELVTQGVDSTSQAGSSLQEIIRMSEQVGAMIAQIATAATEQSAATEEVNRNLDRISQVTASSAVTAEQAARAAQELSAVAHDLQRVVQQFKLARD
jgi:methyl-accepting chemotaxis protein